MEKIIWLCIMVPCSALFTMIGVYARNRKKPMWFWSGTTVEEKEIADIPAYNRANGRMWIGYSLPFWLSAAIGLWSEIAALVLVIGNCVVGIPVLVIVYRKIYDKYKA
ncbi:MAG: hypothetical protein ACI4VM_03280 [Anaerovoracaceae bacterium]